MIHSIKFLENIFHLFIKDEIVTFRPGINLIVGEQGSGKSTLLTLLRHNDPKLEITADLINFFSLDFEKDSPRQKAINNNEGISARNIIMSMWASHGEITNKLLQKLNEESGCLFILDEPDSALSIRSCYKLVTLLKKAEERKCQIIAAVHNPIVISAFPEVLSLEHKKWITSEEFIKLHSH